MSPTGGRATGFQPGDVATAVLAVPLGLLLAYGLLRLSTTLFTELRELVFAKATQGAARRIALETFQHLHALSLRFHLERQTGGMTRDIERGVRGIESLISYSLYSIVPTLIEVALVLTILAVKFDAWFAWITIAALVLYIIFTITVTEWRTKFRREANEFDSAAHTKAVDSLLNYETVKYFNNEGFEARRYDESLEKLRRARLKSQTTLSLLNTGQQMIIAVGLVAMLWRATQGVVDGRMTLGDLVMVNAFMIQLYIPLNFLGVLYREIKQSLTDLDKMFVLMEKRARGGRPSPAPSRWPFARWRRTAMRIDTTVRFENVSFAYERARPILHHVSFEIPAGKTVAVVGPSGLGQEHPGAAAVPLLRRRHSGRSFRLWRPHHHRRPGHPRSHPGQRAPGDRHRAAGHRAVQRHGGIQHRLRQAGRQPRRSGGGRARGAHPQLHRVDPQGLPDHGRRAWAEAVGRREAARGDRPHLAEESADHDFRRSHFGAGLGQRTRDPGRAEGGGAAQDHPADRPPPVHRGGRPRDPGHGGGPDRRARHASGSCWPGAAAMPRCGRCSSKARSGSRK